MNTMRCSHCGWENKERRLKCRKCNSILQYVPPPAPSDRKEEQFSMRSVQPALALPADNFEKICIECNYPLLHDAITCPLCGTPAQRKEQEKTPPTRPDINRRQPSCIMRRLQPYDQHKAPTITLAGSRIALNRDCIDPDNISISQQAHALLEYENDKWYIQDKSEHCTTFIRVANRTELKPGDIIVLGNQRFEFG